MCVRGVCGGVVGRGGGGRLLCYYYYHYYYCYYCSYLLMLLFMFLSVVSLYTKQRPSWGSADWCSLHGRGRPRLLFL